MAFKRRSLEDRRQHRFKASDVALLEEVFATSPIPNRETRLLLARDLSVSERQVQVWLQNKRQRTKRRESLTGERKMPITPPISLDVQRALATEANVCDDLSMEIYLEGHFPFQVLWASNDWMAFCGFSGDEIKGQTMKLIQGPATDREAINILNEVGAKRSSGEATLINYTKARVPFRHTLKIEPLVNSYGQLRIYRAKSRDVQVLPASIDVWRITVE